MDCVRPQPIAESRNSRAATFMTGMRPVRSAMREPKKAPTAAPSRAAATAKPSGPGPTSKVDWIEETAPLITAESYPKRRPPKAATVVMRTTAAVFVWWCSVGCACAAWLIPQLPCCREFQRSVDTVPRRPPCTAGRAGPGGAVGEDRASVTVEACGAAAVVDGDPSVGLASQNVHESNTTARHVCSGSEGGRTTSHQAPRRSLAPGPVGGGTAGRPQPPGGTGWLTRGAGSPPGRAAAHRSGAPTGPARTW